MLMAQNVSVANTSIINSHLPSTVCVLGVLHELFQLVHITSLGSIEYSTLFTAGGTELEKLGEPLMAHGL